MGLKIRALLGRLAAGAPARVFPVAGRGGERVVEAVDRLSVDPRIRLVPSPRSADVLLVVGWPASRLLRPALRVHDQMGRPRATVWWLPETRREADAWDARRVTRLARRLGPAAVLTGGTAEVAEVILACHRQLATGKRESEPAVLPDEEPAPWRGVGPHGQGGEGMMGGTPYGRPMAMTGADLRDGLELDRLAVRLGPFFPHLPPGFVLDAVLQGDVFQEVRLAPGPFDRPAFHRRGPVADPFTAALDRPVPVAVLERARARHHLHWLGRTLRLHDLDALGERALRLAFGTASWDDRERAAAVHRLGRLLRRTRALGWVTRGIGRLEGEDLVGLGPVVRAAGVAEDARTDEPVYRELGFAPVVGEGGDAWARLVQRLRETEQALELAARAGDKAVGPVDRVEGLRGVVVGDAREGEGPSARLLVRVPELLRGLEWGDAMTVLASLDLAPGAAPREPVPGDNRVTEEGEHDHHGHHDEDDSEEEAA